MKFQIAFLTALVILATTTQGFILKSAIKKKLPVLVPALSGLASSLTQNLDLPISSGSISTLLQLLVGSVAGTVSSPSEHTSINESDAVPAVSATIPTTVTTYPSPVQHQVIYRSIRPVVRRTIYVHAPTYSKSDLTDIIVKPISGAISGLKSAIGNVLSPLASAVAVPASAAVSIPAPHVYYLD